jgi:iron complex outermembrane recepter protein
MKKIIFLATVCFFTLFLCPGIIILAIAEEQSSKQTADMLFQLNFDDLMSIKVVSAAKKPQSIYETAAAVFVITQDDIRRSGAIHLADILRMVPGMEVASYNSHTWGAASRGLNTPVNKNLLVMIDGRSIYTPEYAGVWWEAADPMLDDIERIEVVRGPGGTLWGANAVTGVINIITKQAKKSQGTIITAGAGDLEQGFTRIRHGGTLDVKNNIYYRGYGAFKKRDNFKNVYRDDNWQTWQIGFRIDAYPNNNDHFIIIADDQGGTNNDAYYKTRDPLESATQGYFGGHNLLARWQQNKDDSNFTLQLYYDTRKRELPLEHSSKIYDLSWQHCISLSKRNELNWGMNYRYVISDTKYYETFHFTPTTRYSNLYAAFIQNEYNIILKKLFLTTGTKIEYRDYTDWNLQPNIRLLWRYSEQYSIWTAVSRAIRTPTRVEKDYSSVEDYGSYLVRIGKNNEFTEETITAYELGMRMLVNNNFSWDAAFFVNDHDHMGAGAVLSGFDQEANKPVVFLKARNEDYGKIYGFELSSNWNPMDNLTAKLGYTWLYNDIYDTSLGSQVRSDSYGQDPRNQLSLRLDWDFTHQWQLNLWARFVDQITGFTAGVFGETIQEYTTLDMKLAYQPNRDLELSLVGQNLFSSRHQEFDATLIDRLVGKVPRSFYTQLRYEF